MVGDHEQFDVIVVGAGVAGLTAARQVQRDGLKVCVLESENKIGGRVWTDKQNGFLIDRGFQVLLTAYPEPQRWLDFDALRLHPFFAGGVGSNRTSVSSIRRPLAAAARSVFAAFVSCRKST